MRVHLYPEATGEDDGQGGVRRVVEGMQRHLPLRVDLVSDPASADVIACHITIPETYLKNFPEKAFVSHCHGLYWAEYDWPEWAMKANRQVLDAILVADAVTAPSEWVANALRRHTSRDVTVVPHGVDLEEWQPADDDDALRRLDARVREAVERGGYVLWDKTRVDPVCDPEPLRQLAELLPDVTFVSTFGPVAPNVLLVGQQPFAVAATLTRRAGAYLCTTRETFGLGALQALASGVPVVGWAWGGQREFIDHGVDGWLARPGDVAGLARGVRESLANRGREVLAENCRRKAAEFSWHRAAERYVEVYERALERRQRPVRVSVVVPAYKLEAYLPACLASVQAQTMDDWECVVVDDASPDGCGEIAERAAALDPRFRVIHNEENLYLAGARNVGIAASRGRYVLPLDADDMLAPGTLAVLADALDRDRTVHVAYGGVEFRDEDGVTPTDYGHPSGPGLSGWPVPFDLDWQLRGPGQLLPYASMFRREAWELTGGYRRRCRSSEDCDLWLRLSSYGFRPERVTEATTLIYRNRPDSMSRGQGWHDMHHRRWYPWIRQRALLPAGASGAARPEVPSLDPPAVAVIIPVGPGHGRYVLDAIDSVDAQTERRWECIVVNDSGAPLPPLPTWVRVVEPGEWERCQDCGHEHWSDASCRSCNCPAFAGPCFRFVGVAQARNAGIAQARARLFLPLDADDVLQPPALELMLAAHERTGDIIYSDWWKLDDDGSFEKHETADYDPQQLTRAGALHAVTALTPVAVWRDVGGYDEEVDGWEDWAFQLSCAERGFCSRRLAAPLLVYRFQSGMRREGAFDAFERSKASIMAKFGQYWQGGIELMACSSCGKRATVPVSGGAEGGAPAGPALSGAMTLIRYVGPRQGRFAYAGPSGQRYTFSQGSQRYVLDEDVGPLLLNADYQRVEPLASVSPESETPILAVDAR